MSSLKDNPRWLAVRVLERVANGAYSNLTLNTVIRRSSLNVRDVHLLTNLVYGVLQHHLTLRYDLRPFLRKPQRLPQWLLILFETAVYQMLYLDRIPNRAIFDESIQIAKIRGNQGSRRLMTGVLHRLARKGVPALDRIKDPLQRSSVQFSVPGWLVKQLNIQVGKVKTHAILKSINQPAQVAVNVNLKLTTRTAVAHELTRLGYQVKASSLVASGLVVKGREPLSQTAAFRAGKCTLQDQSAMLPVALLPLRKNDVVLDACSAPGGKTCQIAERLDPTAGGRVIALDLHRRRLKKVLKNAQRMHVSQCVKVRQLDARKVNQIFDDQTFDQILVDAPCSGLGLIRNKPEIRYTKTLADVKRLHRIQTAILTAVAPKLKVGGHLMYSTCTILKTENQLTIKDFLRKHPGYRINQIHLKQPLRNRSTWRALQIYPDDLNSDGFFVCNLVRVR